MRRGEESLRITILRPSFYKAIAASKTDNAALKEMMETELANNDLVVVVVVVW